MKNGVPNRVAAAAEEADRALNEASASGAVSVVPDDGEPEQSPAQAPQDPPEATAAAPAPESSASGSDQRLAILEKQVELERHRNESLLGRLNAEGPRQAARIRELLEEIEQLRASVPAKPQGPGMGWKKYLKPEELEEYKDADSVLGVQGRAILGVLEERITGISTGLNAMQRRQEEDQAEQSRKEAVTRFWRAVDAIEPGSFESNFEQPRMAQLSAYAKQIDPDNQQRTRGELAEELVSSGNVRAMASFMHEFHKFVGKPSGNGNGSGNRAASDHEEVRPPRVRGPVSTTISGEPGPRGEVLKASDISAFYTNISKGRFKGTEAELQEKLAAIDLAYAENRVLHDQ